MLTHADLQAALVAVAFYYLSLATIALASAVVNRPRTLP
jgi:hypothetical protein